MQPRKPIEIFYSYSHTDEEYRDKLEKHLTIMKRAGIITNWHDRRIMAGREWEGEIDEHLNTADVILLLVSPDFLASNYCYENEVARAMERHRDREALVIPIIIRPVYWHGAPFGKLNALPRDGKAVTDWDSKEDAAFKQIAEGIQKAIEERVLPYDIEYVDAWAAKFEAIMRSGLHAQGAHLDEMVQSERHLLPTCLVPNLLHFCRVQKRDMNKQLWLASQPEFDKMCKNIESDLLKVTELVEAARPERRPLLFRDVVKLCHVATGRRLYSHETKYTHNDGSGQQQVIAYKLSAHNDYWLVKGPHGEDANYKQGEPVRRGDAIRLEHVRTRRNLHSHDKPSPLSPEQHEVSCFGDWGQGDVNDNWRVEILDDADVWTWDRKVKLIHVNTGWALHYEGKIYWGEQGEVTCHAHRDDNDWWILSR